MPCSYPLDNPAATILIVEDDANVRATLREILADAGYQVATAENGQVALDYLDRHPAPQLILLDLMMPVMDGWEFRRALLADSERAKIPVVVTSGAGQAPQQAASLAAAAYLTKPLDLDHLLQAVRGQIEAVLEAEARNAAVLQAALDAIITLDAGGRVMEWNPAAERLFGYSRASVLGCPLAALILPGEQREPEQGALARFLAGADGTLLGTRFEVTLREVGGAELPVELAVTRVPTAGQPLFTAYARDIRDRRAAEESLRQARDELERRVDERTQALAEANAALLGQIAERDRAEAALRESQEQLLQSQKMEAVGRLDRHPETIQLLLTDVVIPGMTGSQLAEQVATRRPGVRILYMSGYTDDDVVRRGVLARDTAFLQKPFAPDSLARKVRDVLG